MGSVMCVPCKKCSSCTNDLVFNWFKRKYSYRAGIFYYCVSALMIVSIILTFILSSLMKNLNFFKNYGCTASDYNAMLKNFTATMSIGGVIAISCFAMGRLTLMFSNYSLSNFMSLGKWSDRLGCIVKWLPWLISIGSLCWTALSIVNLFYISLDPAAWCDLRWAYDGVVAVQNCRTFYKKYYTGCATAATVWDERVYSCNDPYFLTQQEWYSFAAEKLSHCDAETRAVCNAIQLLVDHEQVDWEDPGLERCYGKAHPELKTADLINAESLSDLFRYLLLYVVSWAIGCLIVCMIFFIIRAITPFDAAFHQSGDESETFLIKILRPLTPWSR